MALRLGQRRELVADVPQLGELHLLHEPSEHLDRRALRADDGVADHAPDDAVVADAPRLHALVELDQPFGELVQVLVLAAVHVELGEGQAGLLARRVECGAESRQRGAQAL